MYLTNSWYVAAWDREVGKDLFPVKMLGEPIVLYRKTNGEVAALEDACPHRKLPLSMGRIKGDTVECGYHGLTFNSTGSATPAPAEGAITVEFRKSGIVAAWNASAQSLLAFAEDQGLKPDFSCRAGICGTCTSRIISGDVAYFEDPLEDLAQGELLLCCSRPKTAIVLDL